MLVRRSLGEGGNKAKTKPIKAKTKPIKANQSQNKEFTIVDLRFRMSI